MPKDFRIMIPLTWLFRLIGRRLGLIACLVLFATQAQALTSVTRYIDTDCANNGDGSAASPCAAGAGAAGPYNRLHSAYSDLVSDYSGSLVTADVHVTLQVDGNTLDTRSGGTMLDGLTQDATRYVTVTASGANRASSTYDAGKYTISTVNGDEYAIRVADQYVRLDGLQFQCGPHTFGCSVLKLQAGDHANLRISNSYFYHDQSSCINSNCNGARAIYAIADAAGPLYMHNNIIANFDYDSTAYGVHIRELTGGDLYFYNNTIVDAYTGMRDEFSNNIIAKNNIVRATVCETGTLETGTNYNSYSCASGTGANTRLSQTFTFVNEGSLNYQLASGDAGAKDFGTDLSADGNLAFSTDIDGQTRSGTWDIGADEYQAAYTYRPFNKLNANLNQGLNPGLN